MSPAATLEQIDGRWQVAGAITMDSAASLLAASATLPLPAQGIIDFKRVEHVDSAGVALMLEWRRRARVESRQVAFQGVPEGVTSLAMLYGVADMLNP
jgi:phospholipid transport system transporter-binding protein